MVILKAFQKRTFYRSKYGERLPTDDLIGVAAAIMSGRLPEEEEVLVHTAYGKTKEDAQRQLHYFLEAKGLGGIGMDALSRVDEEGVEDGNA